MQAAAMQQSRAFFKGHRSVIWWAPWPLVQADGRDLLLAEVDPPLEHGEDLVRRELPGQHAVPQRLAQVRGLVEVEDHAHLGQPREAVSEGPAAAAAAATVHTQTRGRWRWRQVRQWVA